MEALYYAKTGDTTYKEEAYRTFNFVSYFQGLPGGAHAPFFNQCSTRSVFTLTTAGLERGL